MSKIAFSQLPIWYRLTWVFGMSVFVVISYAILFFASMEFRDPSVACGQVGKLTTDIPPEKWVGGNSYQLDNSILKQNAQVKPERKYLFLYFTLDQRGEANFERLKPFNKQCEELKNLSIIGELYPKDFSFSDFANGYPTKFFVDENLNIHENLFGGK